MGRRPGGPGRKSKGDRDHFLTRPPRALGDVIRARADEADLSYSEYIATLLAHAHGMPELAPAVLPPSQAQEELPLMRSA